MGIIDDGTPIEPGRKFKIVKGLEKGKFCEYIEKPNNTNWHKVRMLPGNDWYLLNLDELEDFEEMPEDISKK